jgi:hypothetical protein
VASPQFPFYFAWVNSTETTFGPEHEIVDENVISFDLKHDEGQYPTCEITVKNPRVGLLAPGRKVWAWLSWQGPSSVVPLFFGVLVGIPQNIFAESVTLKFIAQPENYIEQRQAIAETMKVRPFYDPVFTDERHRDDPDTVLEGWSSLWHVDRTTLVTTASDILVGEDGTIDFPSDIVLYDSLQMQLSQPPLSMVEVKARVNWTQRQSGYVDMGQYNFVSYTGETIMSDWPKPGHGLGSGWRVESSFVVDVYAVAQTPTAQSHGDWHNSSENKLQCTPDSSNFSASWPALLSPNSIQATLTSQWQTGICDPFSDPQTNRPASVHDTGVIIPLWYISANMLLRYDAKRQRTEELYFVVTTDQQAVLTSPTIEQRTEVISIQGADVGEPLFDPLAWSDFTEEAVGIGQVIFPNDPTTVGGKSYQICVVAGVAGSIEPAFSDIVGVVTIDGTVHWASMGETPLTTQPDWSPASPVPFGEVICFKEVVFNPATATLEDVANSTSYYICTAAGTTNSTYTTINYVPPPFTSNDAPQPVAHFTYIPRPAFSPNAGTQIVDGSVTWTVLGAAPALLGIPIGGTAENVPARAYFPTDRGLWSVEHLICKARALLRHRSRAVTISFEVPFPEAIDLSCRLSGTIHDDRLPGGVATGKIIAYDMKCNGQTGEYCGHITIGCAVGRGGSAAAVDGAGVYASPGYTLPGYQIMEGEMPTLGDISYSKPVFAPDDDGLSFPLTKGQIIISENVNGDANSQAEAINAAIPASQMLASGASDDMGFSLIPSGGTGGSRSFAGGSGTADFTGLTTHGGIVGGGPSGAWALEQSQRYWTAFAIPAVMEANAVWYELVLKPVQNGPFSAEYTINVSPLSIPQGINLEAPSL